MHQVIHGPEPVIGRFNHPVRQCLPAKFYAILFKLCLLPVKGHGIHIFSLHDMGNHRWRGQAVLDNRVWHRCWYDRCRCAVSFTISAGINITNLFSHINLSRNDGKLPVYFFLHLMQGFPALRTRKVFLGYPVFYCNGWKTAGDILLSAFALFLRGDLHLFESWLWNSKSRRLGFCLVKEGQLIKRNLLAGWPKTLSSA